MRTICQNLVKRGSKISLLSHGQLFKKKTDDCFPCPNR